jgi:hypothetical protein
MAYGLPLCAVCGSTAGIEAHHLYLKADGCPDDLTVWLCHKCHGRAHAMARRINLSEAIRKGQAAKRKATGKRCGGRKTYLERDPELVETARQLSERRPRLSLREISAELAASGYLASSGQPFSASAVSAMLD